MIERLTFVAAASVAAATLVVFVAIAARLFLGTPAEPAPAPGAEVVVPVWLGPLAPTPAPSQAAPMPTADDRATRWDVRLSGANSFRILAGLTIGEVLHRLAADPRVTHDLGDAHPGDLMRRLGLGDGHAEGQFLPDSYHLGQQTAASTILREAHDRMRQALAYAWRGRAAGLPYATPHEALIVASIVERETTRAEDRPRVAAVFVRRMRMGMRLQADPTVIYGQHGHFEGTGTLTRRQLETDTPYNTYTRDGLPPTAIALPGLPSLEAALHPAATTSLYFIGRGDGSTEFSDTYAEHSAAAERYRRPAAKAAGLLPDFGRGP